MLRIPQIKINLNEFYEKYQEDILAEGWERLYGKMEPSLLEKKIRKILSCSPKERLQFSIVKRSMDARKKKEICYNYCVDVILGEETEKRILKREKKGRIIKGQKVVYEANVTGTKKLENPPVIIGLGPAGLICALQLAKDGYAPVIFERGQDVDTRMEDVEHFWKTGVLKERSNVQFGEGGAGTFSDGKLNTTVKDVTGRNGKVLEILVEHGAPEEILYQQKPHIGTDCLCQIVKNIREKIIEYGGKVYFLNQVTNIRTDEEKRLCAVEINHDKWVDTRVAVLAVGHSARDTFAMLKEKQVTMEQKSFAIGVRVEHLQETISTHQYGTLSRVLPPAEYKLTYQAGTGRNIFSFCMCPGGFVVNASSEEGHLVVNGMSNQKRNEKNANSAIVVNVEPKDFGSEDVLAGVEFQRKWERAAYEAADGKIPVQCYGDFKKKQTSVQFGNIVPNTKGEIAFGNIRDCLPDYVCETLEEGMEYFGKCIPGYNNEDVLLLGVETRTSSPVRILRNKEFESSIKGLYPCGEGAGYAGGITSAAMDGLRIYEAIIGKYKPMMEDKGENNG